jgi:hypothetical protein
MLPGMANAGHNAARSNPAVEQLRRLLADAKLREQALQLLASEDQRALLSTKAASEYLRDRWGLKRSVRTLQQMRRDGDGPRYRRSGNDVVYAPVALDLWVRERFGTEVRSTAEEAAFRLLGQG